MLRGPGVAGEVPGNRRWNTDVTGLSPGLLASSTDSEPAGPLAQPALPAVAALVAEAPAPRSGDVELVYGVPQALAPLGMAK